MVRSNLRLKRPCRSSFQCWRILRHQTAVAFGEEYGVFDANRDGPNG